jgi:putative ABC transport system permease protein
MFDIDHWKEVFSALKKNKWRTFFTAFGVFWGIFMLIVMVGSGRGLQNGVTAGLGDFATNSMFVWTQPTTKAYKGYKEGRSFTFNNQDMEALRHSVSGLKYIAPRLQGQAGQDNAPNVVRGLESGAFPVYGDAPVWNKIDPAKIIRGRFLNTIDIKNRRKVAVIGEHIEQVLFKPGEDPLGKYIRVQGVYFQVIGVFKPLNSNINFGGDKNRSVFIPYTTMQQVYNYGDAVHWFAITAKDGVPVSSVEDKILEVLAGWHTVHPEDREAFGYFNLGQQFDQMKGLFTGIDLLIWIVGTGTLMAGVIGVSNIMLVIVKERTQEIGIQRAIGATPFRVMKQIVTESVVLTTLAGYTGLVIGVGVIEAVNYALTMQSNDSNAFRDPEVNFGIAVLALAILVISGIFAGIIPARKAVKIKPIDALRDE